MKKLLLTFGISIGIIFGAKAQTIIATNMIAGQTNQLLVGNYIIGSITAAEGTIAAPQSLQFYDAANTNINYGWTNTTYTRTTITTNFSSVLTNALGTVYTNIYPGQWTSITTNNPATNQLPSIAGMALYSGSTTTLTRNSFSGAPIITSRGLAVVVPAGATNLVITVIANTNSL